MIRWLQVRMHRFIHGEDVFDGWPGDDRPLAAEAPSPTAPVRVRTAEER